MTLARFIADLIADLEHRAAAETDPVQRARLLRAIEYYANNEVVFPGGAAVAPAPVIAITATTRATHVPPPLCDHPCMSCVAVWRGGRFASRWLLSRSGWVCSAFVAVRP